MISLSFNGTVEEVLKDTGLFLARLGGSVATPLSEPKQTKSVKAAEKPVERGVEVSEKPKAEPSTDQLAEIKSIIPKLVKKLGRPAVVELLAEFGATSGGEIKETDRNLFLSKAHTLLSE